MSKTKRKQKLDHHSVKNYPGFMEKQQPEDSTMAERFGRITPTEVADVLGITPQAVYKLLQAQELPVHTSATRRKTLDPSCIRQLLINRGFQYPRENISIQVVKGGSGKTTLAFGLATRAYHYGAKILAIDLDKQANLTRSMGIDGRKVSTWFDILVGNTDAASAVINIDEHLDLIGSSLANARLDAELSQDPAINIGTQIIDGLSPIRDRYDIVIIDCPPDLNSITAAATCASDLVIIPVMPDPYNVDGLVYTLSELNKFRKNHKLNNLRHSIVLNGFDARTKLSVQYLSELASKYEENFLIDAIIRTDATVRNAIASGKSFSAYAKRSSIREDIDVFTRSILGLPLTSKESANSAA